MTMVTEPPVVARDLRLAYRLSRSRSSTLKEFAVNLLKRQVEYEELWALDGVSMDLEYGETLGIIGPNGAGKSTLMKVIAGVLRPTEGRVVVTGHLSPLISLSGGINVEMTGRENIVLFGTLLGRDPADMKERVDDIAVWAGLTDFLNVPVRNYSTGMQARLAFSIATDVKPEILILDEVLAVGDTAFRKKSRERIDYLMGGGTSVLLVSHQMNTIRELAERTLWLDKGRIKALGPSADVVAEYEATT